MTGLASGSKMDPKVRLTVIATGVSLSVAALLVGWAANNRVVALADSRTYIIVNTLTGQRMFCIQEFCGPKERGVTEVSSHPPIIAGSALPAAPAADAKAPAVDAMAPVADDAMGRAAAEAAAGPAAEYTAPPGQPAYDAPAPSER